MSRFHTIQDVWTFLDSIPMFQKSGSASANFSLDNIRDFCEAMGNPQNKFPSIHVAGTNGKGTTCHLLEAIYEGSGFKTGLFTSPHLFTYNERVRVNGQAISDESLLLFFQQTEGLLEEIKLSYFEISTALAFWYFAHKKVDVAIIETGLGGRVDSTNIINSEIAVITSIGLDHQNVLGNTIAEIAREKAGIIKQDKPVVIGNVAEEAAAEIQKTAQVQHARTLYAEECSPEWNQGEVIVHNQQTIHINTPFSEPVNKWNVACAWLVVQELQEQFSVEEKMIISSIQNFEGIPARFEHIHPDFEWYFSGSHNAQALESSIEAIVQKQPLSETVLVFSLMKDKLNEDTLAYFKGFKKAYFVEQEGKRAAKFSDVKDRLEVELFPEERKEIILKDLKTELVIFMGSFYFYSIVKRWTENVS